MGDSRVVEFSTLAEASTEDILLQAREYKEICSPQELTQRAADMLTSQKGVYGGAKVDLYEHGLQTATRAYKDGADEETVVCALLHDIGEILSPSNHGEVPAAILKPFISQKNWWILAHHEVFQGFYYYHMVGGDRNKRDIWRDHEYYQPTIDFCAKYDAPSFDPDYKSFDLDFFKPMMERIFSRQPFYWDLEHPKAVAVTGKKGLIE